MKIKLYTNNSNRMAAVKNITLLGEYEFLDFKDDTDILYPQVLFEQGSLPQAGYAYLDYYDRYYFIENVTKEENGLHVLHLRSDMRVNGYNFYINCNGIIERQENKFNLYLPDNHMLTYEDTFVVTKPIGTHKFEIESEYDEQSHLWKENFIMLTSSGDVPS